MQTLDEREALCVAQALYNAIGAEVSTKDPDNLRGRVSRAYEELYEQTGAKSFDCRIGGEKVGTFSVTVSKPTESKEAEDFVLVDADRFEAWPEFRQVAMDYARNHMQQVADWHFGNTGEVPAGCEMQKYVIAGDQGGRVERTTLKVDGAKVAEALGAALPEVVAGLLEG